MNNTKKTHNFRQASHIKRQGLMDEGGKAAIRTRKQMPKPAARMNLRVSCWEQPVEVGVSENRGP